MWHCNDAKAALGSKLDRHQHIGQGTIGLAPFAALERSARGHAAFIAETPIDEPGDDRGKIEMLKSLVESFPIGEKPSRCPDHPIPCKIRINPDIDFI